MLQKCFRINKKITYNSLKFSVLCGMLVILSGSQLFLNYYQKTLCTGRTEGFLSFRNVSELFIRVTE